MVAHGEMNQLKRKIGDMRSAIVKAEGQGVAGSSLAALFTGTVTETPASPPKEMININGALVEKAIPFIVRHLIQVGGEMTPALVPLHVTIDRNVAARSFPNNIVKLVPATGRPAERIAMMALMTKAFKLSMKGEKRQSGVMVAPPEQVVLGEPELTAAIRESVPIVIANAQSDDITIAQYTPTPFQTVLKNWNNGAGGVFIMQHAAPKLEAGPAAVKSTHTVRVVLPCKEHPDYTKTLFAAMTNLYASLMKWNGQLKAHQKANALLNKRVQARLSMDEIEAYLVTYMKSSKKQTSIVSSYEKLTKLAASLSKFAKHRKEVTPEDLSAAISKLIPGEKAFAKIPSMSKLKKSAETLPALLGVVAAIHITLKMRANGISEDDLRKVGRLHRAMIAFGVDIDAQTEELEDCAVDFIKVYKSASRRVFHRGIRAISQARKLNSAARRQRKGRGAVPMMRINNINVVPAGCADIVSNEDMVNTIERVNRLYNGQLHMPDMYTPTGGIPVAAGKMQKEKYNAFHNNANLAQLAAIGRNHACPGAFNAAYVQMKNEISGQQPARGVSAM